MMMSEGILSTQSGPYIHMIYAGFGIDRRRGKGHRGKMIVVVVLLLGMGCDLQHFFTVLIL